MVTEQKDKPEKSEAPQDVFKNVTYFIVGNVSDEVRKLLDSHGARRDLYLSEMVSHVIADSTEPDEYSEAKELFERPVVSSQWVYLSVKCGKQLPKELFALEGRLFSGLRICPHQLEAEDAKAIWGMVTFHGGQCQLQLDSSVTHLVTAETTGEKYDAALKQADSGLMKIVTPDWITDSIRGGQLAEEKIYHPQLLLPPQPPVPDLPLPPAAVTMTEGRAVAEPMDTSPVPGTVPYHPGHSPGASRRKSSSSDEAYKTNGSRPGTPSAKEALARMVSSRLYASGKSDEPQTGLSPVLHQGPGSVSPGLPAGPLPGMPAGLGLPTGSALPGEGQVGPSLTSMAMLHSNMGHPPPMGTPGMGHMPPMNTPNLAHMPPMSTPNMGHMPPMSTPNMGHMPPMNTPSIGQPGLLPHQGHPMPGMESANVPPLGVPGMPPISTSMHMPVPGSGLPPHLQQQQNHHQQHPQHPQLPPGFPHPHQQQQQQQLQQLQQRQQQAHQQYQHILQQQQLQQQQEKQKQQQQLQQKVQHQPKLQQQPKPQQQQQQQQAQHSHQQTEARGGAMGQEDNRTLRNITNSATTTSPPSARHPSPAKILGVSGQPRPPPPAYPFPTTPVTQPPPPPPPQQQQSLPSPEFWGHDPSENIPPDMCLLGCVFYICDYPEQVGTEETDTWKQIIEQYGGRVNPVYSDTVTHVLAADQKEHPVKTQALKDEKRVVTAYWLNDCLLQKKMLPPWQAMHIPLMFTSEKPCRNQIISITNFTGEERSRVKQMISAIGAKYTGYMTRTNSVLVCKRPGGTKFEKAKEWRVPVVNVQWLSDLVLGEMDALRLPVQMRYLQVGHARDFNADLSKVWQFMAGWTTPLKVPKEVWQNFVPSMKKTVKIEVSDSTVSSSSEPPAKKARVEEESPVATEDGVPRILFTGYPRTVVRRLTAIAEKLGGKVVENPQHCTHLVAQKISRTIKFFHAINICKHIITKEWLEESSLQGRFLEEEKYQLRDEVGEQEIGCNLQESLRRAQKSHIFEGLIFYITPGVTPPVSELTKVIESAGGATLKRRPSIKSTAKMKDEKGCSTFVVITCPNDLHLCRDLIAQNIDVYSAEMALTGVLRQELDRQLYRIDYRLHAM